MLTNDEKRDWRRMLKKAHMCLDCKKQDAYTFAGHVYCYECNAERNKKAREARAAGRGQIENERKKQWRDRMRQEHKCIICGATIPEFDARTRCAKCRAKTAAATRKYYRKTHEPILTWNACRFCGGKPLVEGKKLCRECYAKRLEVLPKAWAAAKERRQNA